MPAPSPSVDWSIRRAFELTDDDIAGLSDVLIDCVNGGASVGFMAPLTRERAHPFWRWIGLRVASGERAILVATDSEGICGTVHVVITLPENQPHRADLSKLLVHRRARGRGLGGALVRAAEDLARESGKTLMVLDAVTDGDAARLYERLGWIRAGDVPNYALMPNGEPCSTTFYFRELNG